MGNTPLLTVRCPQDLLDGIEAQMKETGQNKTEVVVDMLRKSVPSLPIMERAKLPPVSAIYFVTTPYNKLLYIGQTNNLFNRWLQHHRYQQFIEASPDTRVAWFEFDESDRNSMPVVEDELITLLNSEYNGTRIVGDGTKNVLITVRIEEEKRDAFKEWCRERGSDCSKFLNSVISACLDGRIDETVLSSKNLSVDESIANKLDEKIKKLEQQINSQSTDNNLDSRLNEKVARAVAPLEEKIKHSLERIDVALGNGSGFQAALEAEDTIHKLEEELKKLEA